MHRDVNHWGRDRLYLAMLWALTANINRKENTRPFTAEDLMPQGRPKTADWATTQKIFRARGGVA